MAVIVKSIDKGSPADKKGVKPLWTLLKLNGNEITDVLDYRFYQNDEKISAEFITDKGKIKLKKIKKGEYEELGLNFETYLMDKKQRCRNKCIFCFIDQLPEGMRESLYFKDDDSRLSFLFGNYITLTNLSEREIERIIKMHISPINISVHTTNPELRVKMMGNKNAGRVLDIMKRFDEADIKMNCQLVLCPDYNDKDELRRSLKDLLDLKNVECIAAVPVGLTKYRENLPVLKAFDKKGAEETIDIIDEYGTLSLEIYGDRRCFAADEFYLTAQRKIPPAVFYGDFLQLENGVGLWALLKQETDRAFEEFDTKECSKKVTLVTGYAAYPLIKEIALKCEKRFKGLVCNTKRIRNDYFGEKITVAGLITATDIENQLKGKDLGDEVIIPSVMLNAERTMFLDSRTAEDLQKSLNTKITVTETDGYSLIESIICKG